MRPSPGWVVFVGGLLLVCGNCRIPTAEVYSEPDHDTPPIGVSALSLTQTPDAYKDVRVRLLLPARGYRTNSTGILWVDGQPSRPPLLIECCPPAGKPPLDIIGTCRGRVGEQVVIGDCSISPIANLPLSSRAASARP